MLHDHHNPGAPDGGRIPKVLDFLDCEPRVEYLVNLASNAVLKRKVKSAMQQARRASKVSGQTEHVYGECRYATRKTWPWKRRVIYKAEVVRAANKEPKDNPRFVVTNLKQDPQWIYEQIYCQRGDMAESYQGIARRHADRPDQLLELLGKHLPGATDGGGLCADARDAPSPGTDPPRPGASRYLAGTLSKTRSPNRCHGAAHRGALASSVSLPR